MEATAPRVAIAGAGIGGLAAAVALSQRGFPVDVYEQAAAFQEVGAGLHLGSNGSRALGRWGLAGKLRESAVRPVALEVRDWKDGSTLVRQPMGDTWQRELGAPYYTIHRADLHRILASLVPEGRVHMRRRLAGFATEGDAIQLRFTGGSTAEADVLVGADGIHSVIRQSVAGGQAAPVYSGVSAYRGLVPMAQLPGLPATTILLWAGPRSRLLCYPVSQGRFLTFVALIPDARWRLESWSSPGDPADLSAAFAGWNPQVEAIIGAVEETRRWALYDREPIGSWGAGPVTLIGDAAHPMLPHHGQGASQAIEDAVALAHCLGAAGEADGAGRSRRLAASLRRYESVRGPHTARVQRGSRGSGSLRMRPAGRKTASDTLSSLFRDAVWVQRYDVAQQLAAARSAGTHPHRQLGDGSARPRKDPAGKTGGNRQ